MAHVALCETTVCHNYNNNRDLRKLNTQFHKILWKRGNSAATAKFCSLARNSAAHRKLSALVIRSVSSNITA